MSASDDSSSSDAPTIYNNDASVISGKTEAFHTATSHPSQIDPKTNTKFKSQDEAHSYQLLSGAHDTNRFHGKLRLSESTENEPSESTPLLNQSAANSPTFSNRSIAMPIQEVWSMYTVLSYIYNYVSNKPYGTSTFLVIVTFVILNSFFVVSNLETAAKQAVSISVDSVSILDLNDKGVTYHVLAYVSFSYQNISNYYLKYLLKAGSLVIGGLTTYSKENIKIFVSLPNDSLRHVLNIDLPKIDMDLLEDHITFIDIIHDAEIIESNAAIVLDRMMESLSKEVSNVSVELRAIGNLQLQNKYMNLGNHEFDITEKIQLNYSGLPDFAITRVLVEETDGGAGITTDLEILVENDYPLDFSVPSIDWEFYLEGCAESDLIKVGTGNSDILDLRPLYPIIAKIEFEFPKLSQECLTLCSNGFSPLEICSQKVLNEEKNLIYVKAADKQGSELASWFLYILSRRALPIPMIIPLDVNDDYLKKKSINKLAIDVPKNAIDTAIINSNLSIIADRPSGLNVSLDVPKFKGDVSILVDEKVVGIAKMENWQNSKLSITDEIIANILLYDSKFVVLEPTIIGEQINSFLWGKNITFELAANLDLELHTPIQQSVLHGLKKAISMTLPGSSDILMNISAVIHDLSYVHSNTESLSLSILCEILNPVNLDISLNGVDVLLRYNDTTIGHASIDELNLKPADFSNVSISLQLGSGFSGSNFDDEEAKEKLEGMLSNFLSGDEPTIQISGYNNSIKSSSILSTLMSEISVDTKVPNYRFDHEQSDSMVSLEGQQQTGFILDATMHIMTSDVEFTVFNPFSNAEVIINIYKGEAYYEDTVLGRIEKPTLLLIPPGISTTPRIPITYATGIGGKILKKAMNGNLMVQGRAVFRFTMADYEMDLLYKGKGLDTKIRI